MQMDRSAQWAKENNRGRDCTRMLAAHDLHTLWLSRNESHDGVLGDEFLRLQMYIATVQRDRADSRLYHVRGQSRTRRKSVCDFLGTVRLQRAGELPAETPNEPRHGILTAEYRLRENERQSGSGLYRGVVATLWRNDTKGEIILDDRDDGADAYQNNTFVGIWTSYHTGKDKRCLWGDDRLPYVQGFDVGDGEIVVAPRYRKNGWETYGTNAESNDHWWR